MRAKPSFKSHVLSRALRAGLLLPMLLSAGCVLDPYYDAPPAPASYGYYGYGPAYYPWAYGGAVNVDIANGYGHGGYYGGGWGREGWGGGRWR